MVRELVSRKPAVSPLEAVQEKPKRGHVLVHLPDLLVDPRACELGNRLLPQGRVGALRGHLDAKGVRKTRTVTLGSRRTVGVSRLIQSRGLSPTGCIARIRRRLGPR